MRQEREQFSTGPEVAAATKGVIEGRPRKGSLQTLMPGQPTSEGRAALESHEPRTASAGSRRDSSQGQLRDPAVEHVAQAVDDSLAPLKESISLFLEPPSESPTRLVSRSWGGQEAHRGTHCHSHQCERQIVDSLVVSRHDSCSQPPDRSAMQDSSHRL